MATELLLPKSKCDIEKIVKDLVGNGCLQRNPQAVKWWLSHYYMQGVRDFTNIDYKNGTVQLAYMNGDGHINFKYEDIVSKYQTQLGRLMGMDLSPRIKNMGISLDGLRKSSISQVVLDIVMPPEKVIKLKQELFPPLLHYGTMAVIPWFTDADTMGIEVVPPWEILPIPVNCSNDSQVKGYIRTRKVSKDWINRIPGTPSKNSKVYKEMKGSQVQIGERPDASEDRFQSYSSRTLSATSYFTSSSEYPSGGRIDGKENKTKEELVDLWEVWTKTEDGYLNEYLLFGGGKLLVRNNFQDYKIHMPVHIIRDIEVGGFWGRSFVELLMPVNSQLEHSISRMFENLAEWDLFGLVLMPTTLGIPESINRGVDGLKRIVYEPDYTSKDLAPTNIPPANSGTLPAQILQVGLGLNDKISNQPAELMSGSAPGRVDSAAALGTLYETSGIPLSPTAMSISAGIAGCYRVLLSMAAKLWDAEKIIRVTNLDDALAGIKLDPTTGQLALADNAIPAADEVRIMIGSEMPKSKQQEKAELKEALATQVITPFEYRIKVRVQGLDLPVGNEAEWQNYRRAMLENLILFGDGMKPGPVIVSDYDMHQVHLEVLQGFMARPEFYLASVEVRNKFVVHYKKHLEAMGQFPDQLPYPEEAAEMSQQEMAMQQSQNQMHMEAMNGMGDMGGVEGMEGMMG